MKIYKTREPEMGYTKVEPGLWRFVTLQSDCGPINGTKCVGPYYHSKIELLTDCERYLTEWGY